MTRTEWLKQLKEGDAVDVKLMGEIIEERK